MKCHFNKILYRYSIRQPKNNQNRIKILGIDSESDTNGRPFMFAVSDGTIIKPPDLLSTLFQAKYRGFKFVCYNLKYDEGSILQQFPPDILQEIRHKGKVIYDGLSIRSIPRKELVINNIKQKQSIVFYDISQFFGTSLNSAARCYLGRNKIPINTKKFFHEYIITNWDNIAAYCLQDAILTKDLADYFLDILRKELDIYPQKLYSTGYITGMHFAKSCELIDVKRYYRYYPECLEYAYLSYAGGKFETYQRGFGEFYQYDINSAYPYEISNLQDIRFAKVLKSSEYQPTATYGFIKCRVLISNDYSPVPLKINNVNRYPIGSFTKIITKNEFDYLISKGDGVDIIDAWWIICPKKYPYKAEIKRLYKLKQHYKNGDKLRYMLIKILLNSFYGKFIQITEKYRKEQGKIYEAGWLFNPIYASVITANTRVKVCKVCDKYDKFTVAVHTDSIITSKKISKNELNIGNNLGEWNFENRGGGVIVGSGVYQIGDKVHFRGYQGLNNLSDLVRRNRNSEDITINQRLVLSWRLVVFRNGNTNMINRFTRDKKTLNLNFDRKRHWLSKWSWENKLVTSKPFIEVNT
ncbi:hypothetical protein CMI37_38900 [Candidatus Pacearchaeota archaeon]|nr:hypothetical protein [Candidatus Pacearchaeota archaeon]